jgi:hypothetical protein
VRVEESVIRRLRVSAHGPTVVTRASPAFWLSVQPLQPVCPCSKPPFASVPGGGGGMVVVVVVAVVVVVDGIVVVLVVVVLVVVVGGAVVVVVVVVMVAVVVLVVVVDGAVVVVVLVVVVGGAVVVVVVVVVLVVVVDGAVVVVVVVVVDVRSVRRMRTPCPDARTTTSSVHGPLALVGLRSDPVSSVWRAPKPMEEMWESR